jgi:glycosyltransferase involved in cell wall biosynthesis
MVSVIIPNYNHEKYLKLRIDSVLNQTYKCFEIIILDDKSIDNSHDIIEEYRGNPKVSHIIYNEINSGSTFKQWNKGISFAKGDYIWIAESDDIADPCLLETLVHNLEKENSVLSYSNLTKISSEGNSLGDWIFMNKKDIEVSSFSDSFVMKGRDYIERFLLIENTIPNASGVLFRKDAFYEVGQVDEDIKYCSDWLLWLKLLTLGSVSYANEKLNYFRIHDHSVIATAGKQNNDVFLKKYDVKMHIRYDRFLHAQRQQNSLLAKKNRLSIAKASIIEMFYLIRNKKIGASIKYFIYSLYYSRNIFFPVNYIINKLK